MRKSILPILAFSLLLAASILFVTTFEVAVKSSAQNANSSKTTNRNSNDSRSIPAPSSAGVPQDFSKNTWELPEDADKTKNPTTATPESIAKGKELFHDRDKGNCIFCHGETGAGNEANLPRLRRKPADLTNKERMTAMTDGELFWKITKGIMGIMPAGERRITQEEDRWHVVNYVRTLAKEQQ